MKENLHASVDDVRGNVVGASNIVGVVRVTSINLEIAVSCADNAPSGLELLDARVGLMGSKVCGCESRNKNVSFTHVRASDSDGKTRWQYKAVVTSN